MKKSKRTDTPVNEVVNRGLPQAELQKAVKKECDLAHQDKLMEETKDKKNAVESYVYDMRNKVFADCNNAEKWLIANTQEQDAMPKNADPIISSADIRRRTEDLDRYCKPIMSQQKPKSIPKSGDAKDPKQNAPHGGEQSSEPMDIDREQGPESTHSE